MCEKRALPTRGDEMDLPVFDLHLCSVLRPVLQLALVGAAHFVTD
jgi:hypothetical protein